MKYCLRFSLMLILVLFSTQSLFAQMSTVPISFQIAIIKQIMVADPIIKSQRNGIILIVKNADSEKKAELMANAFIKQGIKAEITEDPSTFIGRSVITIYFMTDTIIKPSFIGEEKILTIALNPNLVVDGEVALSIRSKEGANPEIVINKKEIESVGHGSLIKYLNKAVVY